MTYNQAPVPGSESVTTGPWTMKKIETPWGDKMIQTTILTYRNSSGDDLIFSIHNYPDGFGGPKWSARVLSGEGYGATKKFRYYEVAGPESDLIGGDNQSYDATSLAHDGRISPTTLQPLFENPYLTVGAYNQDQGKFNPLKPRAEYIVKPGEPAMSSMFEWNGVMSNFQTYGGYEKTQRDQALTQIGIDPEQFASQLQEVSKQTSSLSPNRRN